jgi:glycosyltransferase involved in cell wall biosynthesis
MAIDPYTVDQFVLKDLPNVPKRATLEIPFTKELSKYDFKQSDLLINSQILDKWRRTSNRTISSINWFVPDFLNVYGGGHHTIFRFADHLSRKGIENRFIIYDSIRPVEAEDLEGSISEAFPNMRRFRVITHPTLQGLPYADVTIATTWQSAYSVLHFNNTRGKYYFIQDYEPLFYPAGSIHAIAEATYRFGFPAITFGRWLRDLYVNGYKHEAVDFMPCAERDLFWPDPQAPREKPERIFFFARPISERRAFELGIMALRKLNKKYPDLEIVLAGWDISQYKIPFQAKQLGNLTLNQTASLYRQCDIGLCFSITNLSLVPLQLMASGCTTITNYGPNVEWLLKHKYNCILTDPTPSSILESFEEAINDYELRKKIFDGGLETIRATSWDREFEKVYSFMLKGGS